MNLEDFNSKVLLLLETLPPETRNEYIALLTKLATDLAPKQLLQFVA